MTDGVGQNQRSMRPTQGAAGATGRGEVVAAFRELKGVPIRTFLICLCVWTVVNLEQSMFGYAMPAMVEDLGISIQTVGLVISLGFGAAIFGAILIGLLTDRFGRRVMLAGCFGLSAILYALQGLAGSVLGLAMARSGGAAISAGLSPITNSYVAETSPPRIRALMIGFLQTGFPLGWFLASILVAPLLTHFGWRAVFLVSLVVPAIAWLIFRSIPETPRFQVVQASAVNRRPMKDSLAELLAPGFRKLTLLSILAFFAKGGAYAGLAFYMPAFMHDVRGYDASVAAYVVGISYGIGILGYISASVVGEFFLSRRTTIVIWSWLGALSLVAFVWIPTRPIEDVVAFGIMAIFSFGTSAILTTFVLEQFPTRMRATGAACASASVSLGFATLPVLVATLVGQIGWQWAISLCVTPLLVICGAAVLWMPGLRGDAEIGDF